MSTLLQIRDVSKKGEEGAVLSGITFTQEKLEKIAIAGETGAGKSTLLKLIAGLIQPDGGQLLFEGKKIIGPEEQLVPGHPGIAYLSQHFELQKFLRVEQVLGYSNTLSQRAADTLYHVCRIDHLLKRKTDQLSGGEKQRVAICRLLITAPRLLLLDEPFSHLDMVHKNTLKAVIGDIGDKLKITCMLVSHDPLDTLSWADKILVMREGRIIQEDGPAALYNKPVNEYAGALFGNFNVIRKEHFRIFCKLPFVKSFLKKTGAGNIFLRPENLKVVRKNPNALRGKVENIRFFGSYIQLQVRISSLVVLVRTKPIEVSVGDTVYLSASARHLWSV